MTEDGDDASDCVGDATIGSTVPEGVEWLVSTEVEARRESRLRTAELMEGSKPFLRRQVRYN